MGRLAATLQNQPTRTSPGEKFPKSHFINLLKPNENLTSLKLNHASRSRLVNHTVPALLTPDGVVLAQGEGRRALGAVVAHPQGLGGRLPKRSMRDGSRHRETLPLRRTHRGLVCLQ